MLQRVYWLQIAAQLSSKQGSPISDLRKGTLGDCLTPKHGCTCNKLINLVDLATVIEDLKKNKDIVMAAHHFNPSAEEEELGRPL